MHAGGTDIIVNGVRELQIDLTAHVAGVDIKAHTLGIYLAGYDGGHAILQERCEIDLFDICMQVVGLAVDIIETFQLRLAAAEVCFAFYIELQRLQIHAGS